MLLLEQCQQLSLTQDSALLSKLAFRVERAGGDPQLWWCLNFLHEKLTSKGEKRKLYRWICFFRESVLQTKLVLENVEEWLHMRKNDLPHNALLHHVATSEAIIAFVAFVLRDARKESLIFFAVIGFQPSVNVQLLYWVGLVKFSWLTTCRLCEFSLGAWLKV